MAAKNKNNSPSRKAVKKTATTKSKSPARGAGGGNNKERILHALVVLKKAGKSQPTKESVRKMARYTSDKTFKNNLAKLKNEGWVEYHGQDVSITDTGVEQVGEDSNFTPPTNEEFQENLLATLKGRSKDVFHKLTDGKTHQKEAIKEACGFNTHKTFSNAVGPMKTSGMVEYPTPGTMRLTDEAFPFGRPN